MGNACTGTPQRMKRNVTVPTHLPTVKVRKGSVLEKEKGNISTISVNTTAATNKIDNSHSVSQNKPKDNSPDTFLEANNINLHPRDVLRPLISDHDLLQLGIGIYFLESQLQSEMNSYSRTKQKKIKQIILKWDKVFHSLQGSSKKETNLLYESLDINLKESLLQNSKGYFKMAKHYISPKYRWSIWKCFAQIDKYYVEGLYENLKEQSSKWESDINKDIHRTFPHEPYFSKDKSNALGQAHLFNILKAISLYLPNIGYAQSMNFIIAFILMVNGGRELDAFWMFITLARDHRYLIMGFFEKDFPLLQFYTFVFYEILQKENPKLYNHLKKQQIPDLLWLFKWFLTLFIYSLPLQAVVKIWDCLLANGSLYMINIALGIVKYFEKDILSCDAFGLDGLFKSIKNEKNKYKNENSENTKSIQKDSEDGITQIYKEFNIEEALKFANKIKLGNEKIKFYASRYESKTNKTLPKLYQNTFMNLKDLVNDSAEDSKFQEDVASNVKQIN